MNNKSNSKLSMIGLWFFKVLKEMSCLAGFHSLVGPSKDECVLVMNLVEGLQFLLMPLAVTSHLFICPSCNSLTGAR